MKAMILGFTFFLGCALGQEDDRWVWKSSKNSFKDEKASRTLSTYTTLPKAHIMSRSFDSSAENNGPILIRPLPLDISKLPLDAQSKKRSLEDTFFEELTLQNAVLPEALQALGLPVPNQNIETDELTGISKEVRVNPNYINLLLTLSALKQSDSHQGDVSPVPSHDAQTQVLPSPQYQGRIFHSSIRTPDISILPLEQHNTHYATDEKSNSKGDQHSSYSSFHPEIASSSVSSSPFFKLLHTLNTTLIPPPQSPKKSTKLSSYSSFHPSTSSSEDVISEIPAPSIINKGSFLQRFTEFLEERVKQQEALRFLQEMQAAVQRKARFSDVFAASVSPPIESSYTSLESSPFVAAFTAEQRKRSLKPQEVSPYVSLDASPTVQEPNLLKAVFMVPQPVKVDFPDSEGSHSTSSYAVVPISNPINQEQVVRTERPQSSNLELQNLFQGQINEFAQKHAQALTRVLNKRAATPHVWLWTERI